MKEGYYWIQHVGVVQVAYYTNDTVDDLESGQVIVGVWHLTRGDDICHNGEAEVLSGRYNHQLRYRTHWQRLEDGLKY
ncbi:hypothetical protein AB6J65_003512 [Salmonella enterica]|nr:hypothetical protein [Salmonella enterica]EEA5168934.1 hypothetical protein [Salmonella enterica]EEC2541554.1 hypothetical protein [Salmonella enterica]EFB0112615.1 hypothetical protein [Salmonella enterica]EIZ8058078.1 hypothetical protein [Salmonella enterica]